MKSNDTKTINVQSTKESLLAKIKLTKTLIKKKTNEIGLETNEKIIEVREEELQELNDELNEYEEELNEIESFSRNEEKQDLIELIKNNHIVFIANENRYLEIKNQSTIEERVNLVSNSIPTDRIVGILNNLYMKSKPKAKAGRFAYWKHSEIRTVFEECNASYNIRTASFDTPKWDSSYVFNTMDIQRLYWAPIDRGTDYESVFDDLMYSLSGGKQENVDHLEKWISYKYLYPEKSKITPGLNITGTPGGNGKGMFTSILNSVFTPLGVTLIKGKNITGGFNQIMEAKVITILDDERKEGFPQTEIKQITGNPSIVIEPKGVDAYSVDATSNLIVLDNTGLVKLVGGGSGGEDRRWSIIKTEYTLFEVLMEKYDIDENGAKQMAEWMGKLFEDRIECGKWLSAMIDKHKVRDMPILLAHHGQDYLDRLKEQRDNWTPIFESILPILNNQGVIPWKFIKEIVQTETMTKTVNDKRLSAQFDEFLSRNGIKNVEKTETRVTIVFSDTNSPIPDETEFKGTIRRIRSDAKTFDYSLVSKVPYRGKKSVINADTIEIKDFFNNFFVKNGFDQNTVGTVGRSADFSNSAKCEQNVHENGDFVHENDENGDFKIRPSNDVGRQSRQTVGKTADTLQLLSKLKEMRGKLRD